MSERPPYPSTPATARIVTGGTAAGDTITATTTTVAITRTLRPLHIGGSAGLLIWTATVTGAGITTALFRLSGSPTRATATRPGTPASAVLTLPAADAVVTATIVVTCTVGATITVTDRWAQTPRPDTPVVLADPDFGQLSGNGVPAPAPPVGMPVREATSAARRSPQVRAAQRGGLLRPDLLPRQNAAL